MTTKTTPAAVDPVAALRAEVDRLFALEQEWSAKRLESGHQLAAAEAGAGPAVLDGASAGDLARRLGELRAAADLADRAITEARRRRVEAIQATYALEGDHLRARAAALRRQADERRLTTDRMLAELAAFEECAYGPVRPMAPPVGRAPDGSVIGGALLVVMALPKTALMLDQADALEASAAQQAARRVPDAGQVVGQDADQLRADLAALGAMQIAPPGHAVEAWLSAGLLREQERRARLQPGQIGHKAPTVYRLVWSGGAIDVGRSRVGPPEGWDEYAEERAGRPERAATAAARAAREAAGKARDIEGWNRWATEQNALNAQRARDQIRVG